MKGIRADEFDEATFDLIRAAAVDVTGAVHVQVEASHNGTVHVNLNGVCVLRICQAKYIDVSWRKQTRTYATRVTP